MKKTRKQDARIDYEPSFGEFAAAAMLGFMTVGLLVYAVRFWERGTVDVAGVTILCGMAGAFLWVGGRGLRQARTWTVAAKAVSGAMLLIGLTTALTGYHNEGGGQYKVWRKVDRDAYLSFVVFGLVLLGAAHVIDTRLKSKRAAPDTRSGQR